MTERQRGNAERGAFLVEDAPNFGRQIVEFPGPQRRLEAPAGENFPVGRKGQREGPIFMPAQLVLDFSDLRPVKSQTTTWVSPQPVASILPSGLNAMPLGLPSSFAHDFGSLPPSLCR